ncbi:ABC transporter permease [Nocardioides pacificus]
MWRAALKSLLGRKIRLLLSTFAIVLGIAFVAGTLVFTDTLERSFTALFASTVGDVVVRPEGGDISAGPSTRTLPAELVEDLRDTPGAARVDGNVSANGVFVIGTDDKVIGGQGAPGLGLNWNDAPAGHGLEGLTIVDGAEPTGPDEIALDVLTADKAGYEIGDEVLLNTVGAEPVLRKELVGTADFADGGSLNGATLTIFDTATSQQLFHEGEDVFNDIWVTAEDGVSQEELRDAVAAELPDGVEAVTGDTAADESASQLLEAISFLSTFLLIFAGISLIVGAFLIVNTFSILVAQRSRELALLRALGASQGQVTRSVLLEALILGLLGSTLGLGLGVLLAMLLKWVFSTFVGLEFAGQSLVFQTSTVVVAYVVGVAVTMAAAWLPARHTSRIAPVQAMRDDIALPETSIRRRLIAGIALVVAGLAMMTAALLGDVPRAGWVLGAGMLAVLLGVAGASPVISYPFLAGASWLSTRVFGTVGRLAGQNSLRNPRRTTATASALMIGLALAGTMSIVGASAKASIDQIVDENFRGDFVVSNAIGEEFSSALGDQIADVDGVGSVAALRYAFGSIDGSGQGISAGDLAQLEQVMGLKMIEGEVADVRDGTVVVSEGVADDGVEVGDVVTYEVFGSENELEVVGVFEENPLVGFPYVTTEQTLIDAGVPDNDRMLVIEAEPGADLSLVQGGIDEVVSDLRMVTVKDQAEFAAEQRDPIDQLVTMIFALLGLALLIAVLGIVNTLALSIIERTHEIGLLRAIGLSRRQLRRMVTLESVVIATLGATLGVLLGIGFGVALTSSLRSEGLEVIAVPSGQLLIFLGVAVVVGVLAAVLPARRAAKLNVLDAIATD